MLLFGLHVPKCAGTTFLMRAMSRLAFNQVYQCTNLERNFRENRIEFAHMNDHARLKLVFGHFVHEEMLKFFKGPIQLFTGLREPRARLKSHLIFMRALRRKQGLPPLDMETEIAQRKNNMCASLISRFPVLAGDGTPAERALRVLDHCWCVYFSERFEETAAPIYRALNIVPEERNHNIGEYEKVEESEEIDLSTAHLQQDVILYETALERFATQKAVSKEAEENIAAFRAHPINHAKLRKSFYSATFTQYGNSGYLERVIQQRKAMIAELNAELRRYSELMEGEDSLSPAFERARAHRA